ncbi:hypothetical protein JYT95_01460 [bacterium AH-315-J23]|nr:hypothetical protein [bacterium AH-315-J23]
MALDYSNLRELSQSTLKSFRFSFARKRYPDFAFAVPLVAMEACFKLVEIELARVSLINVVRYKFIPCVTTRFACGFNTVVFAEVKYLYTRFPTHQKSSALGMRV